MSDTANTKAKVIGPEATALINTLKANPGKSYTFAELAAEAGVPAKTGYLRAVKDYLKGNLEIGEVEILKTRKTKVNTYMFDAADAE